MPAPDLVAVEGGGLLGVGGPVGELTKEHVAALGSRWWWWWWRGYPEEGDHFQAHHEPKDEPERMKGFSP